MNFDKCYCSGQRCGLPKKTCARSVDRVKEYFAENGISIRRPIKIVELSDPFGRCENYQPQEDEKAHDPS